MTRALAGCLAAILISSLSVPAQSATITTNHAVSGTFAWQAITRYLPDGTISYSVKWSDEPFLQSSFLITTFDRALGNLDEVILTYYVGYWIEGPFDSGYFDLELASFGMGSPHVPKVRDSLTEARPGGSVFETIIFRNDEAGAFEGPELLVGLTGHTYVTASSRDVTDTSMNFDLRVAVTYVYEPVAAVPLPPAAGLLAAGLGALGLVARRRRRGG